MSEGKRTPGPFFRERSPISDDEIIFRLTGEAGNIGGKAVPVCRPVALLYETMDNAERDELVDLLNKGTHYDAELAAELGEVAAQRDALKAAGEAVLDEFIGANEPTLNALDAAISACEGGQNAEG